MPTNESILLDQQIVATAEQFLSHDEPLPPEFPSAGEIINALCATVKHLRAENQGLREQLAQVEKDFNIGAYIDQD